MSVSPWKVYRRVAETWVHTILCLCLTAIVVLIFIGLASELLGVDLVLSIVEGLFATSILFFFAGEVFIVRTMGATRATKENAPVFLEVVAELLKNRWMKTPRLYVIDMEEPQALAFGVGFCGQYAIAVSTGLIKMMDREELKATVSHELGHIRSKDVGLVMVISLLVGTAKKLGWLLVTGRIKMFAGTGLFFGLGLMAIGWLLFPIGLAAIRQEREFAADALSALDMQSPDPVISALKKLQAYQLAVLEKNDEKPIQLSFINQLLISHPGLDQRIATLESYRG